VLRGLRRLLARQSYVRLVAPHRRRRGSGSLCSPGLERLFTSVGEACGAGPFTRVEGAFTVLMCPTCLAQRSRGRGPYPDLTDAELRAGLDQLATWVLEQKAAANRRVIAVMRERLERGELVARMSGPLGLAWLQREAEIAEQLIQERTSR